MKPMVDTSALMAMKVVRSLAVVAFEMYVMHSVTEPIKYDEYTHLYINRFFNYSVTCCYSDNKSGENHPVSPGLR